MQRASFVAASMAQELAEALSSFADKRGVDVDKLLYWRHEQFWAEKAGVLEAEKVAFLDTLDKENPEGAFTWREQSELEITEMICEVYTCTYNSHGPAATPG